MNNTSEFSNLTTSEDDTVPSGIDTVQIIGKVLFFTFTIIGFASNIALIGIYKKKDLTLRFNSLMLTLAFFDLTTIVFYILTAILQLTIGHDQILLNSILLYWDRSLIVCSAYTMVAIALDRYLSLCKGITNNQYKLPIKWTMIRIIVVSLVLISPYHAWNHGHFAYFVITLTWQFMVEALIPCTLLLILTTCLIKKLHCLKADAEFADYADVVLRKCILKVRLFLLISSIFVISQILVWLPTPYDVSYIQIHFWFITVMYILTFQIIFWTPNERVDTVLEKYHVRKTIKASGILVQVINFSSNFFAYKYLKWKESNALAS